MQTILYAPLLPGSYIADTEQAFRNFMAALYIFDCELSDHQVLYLHLDHEREIDFSEFRHIKEMPKDFDVPDFAAACDIFISDYHNALSAKFSTGTQIIRFLCGTFWNQEDEFFPEYPAFDNVPELVRYIGQFVWIWGNTCFWKNRHNIFSQYCRLSPKRTAITLLYASSF